MVQKAHTFIDQMGSACLNPCEARRQPSSMMSAELLALRHAIAHAGERRLIWLEGEQDDCIVRAESLLWGRCSGWGRVLSVMLRSLPPKALQRLGQECDTLVFNAFSGFHPDAFGALAGTLRAGGSCFC